MMALTFPNIPKGLSHEWLAIQTIKSIFLFYFPFWVTQGECEGVQTKC
jgi:hypothetical protein